MSSAKPTTKVAVLGAGIWGKNLVRNFYNLNYLHTVCDMDEENRKKVNADYPEIYTTPDFNEVLNNKDINAVVIATPSHTHFKLVKQALEAEKHVYVEKPIATASNEALIIKELEESKKLVLMVGHLLLYHPADNRLKMIVSSGELGEIKYVQSDRLNINYFKNDRSVMWDLAPHDVSMVSYILGEEPAQVISAMGVSSEGNEIMDITHIEIEYESGCIAHISDSWIHPQKRVNLMLRGTKGSAMFDDTLKENKLQVFKNDKPNSGSTIALDYIEIEPLKLECEHFVKCIENGKKARSDGENGYFVVKILEDAEKMMLGDKLKLLNQHNFVSSRSKQ